MDCEFEFVNNTIKAKYIFDKAEQAKIDMYNSDSSKKKKLKAYSSYIEIDKEANVNMFQADIESIVDLSEIKLEVSSDIREKQIKAHSYISKSNFLNIYNFAIILNGRWGAKEEWKKAKENNTVEAFLKNEENQKKFTDEFGELSLEYKLSNINQAKSFAKYLNEIGCFYTNADVDFEMVQGFDENENIKIGILEHQRWLQEHYDMGWTYGNPEKDERDLERKHRDMIPDFMGFDVSDEAAEENYKRLDKAEQDKDTEPMECMLAMLKMFDGLRIYRFMER